MTRMAWELDQMVDIEVCGDQDDDGSNGIASLRPTTFAQNLKRTVDKLPQHHAIRYKRNRDPTWHAITYQQYYHQCVTFAKALLAIGLQRHDCVNILGFNSPEWFFANNGAILAGGIPAGIYTTCGPDACKHISSHCQARFVVVDSRIQLEKYCEIATQLPNLQALILWNEPVPTDLECPAKVYAFDEFMQLASDVDDQLLQTRMDQQQPGECCTLIYTSGTTGPPKAVMASHDNLTWAAANVIEFLHVTPQERIVSYLPLSQIAAQIMDIHVPIQLGCTVHFASPDALKSSLVTTLKEVRPTIFFGVPRVWERIMEKMIKFGQTTTGVQKAFTNWAKARGAENTQLAQFNAQPTSKKSLMRSYLPSMANFLPTVDRYTSSLEYYYSSMGIFIASNVMLIKVKEALGIDQARLCLTGAAPISAEVIRYFGTLDVPLYEIFGQCECMGPHTLNAPGKWKIGTVGQPMNGTETRIDPEAGEIQFKGRHVFMGYLHDEKATRETLAEGWLHSGDIGKMDDDGFLSITGRIKELIITAGGEHLAPVLMEEALKEAMPALSNAMVIGDRRKYLTFVCTLRTKLDPEGKPTSFLDETALRIGEEIGSAASTVEEARMCSKWRKYLVAGMMRVNENASCYAHVLQRFELLPRDFSIVGGELTPNMKLKRSTVLQQYADLIESMYTESR